MVTSVAGKPHPEQDQIEDKRTPGLSSGWSLDPDGNIRAR